jgi:hypothetical protein
MDGWMDGMDGWVDGLSKLRGDLPRVVKKSKNDDISRNVYHQKDCNIWLLGP